MCVLLSVDDCDLSSILLLVASQSRRSACGPLRILPTTQSRNRSNTLVQPRPNRRHQHRGKMRRLAELISAVVFRNLT